MASVGQRPDADTSTPWNESQSFPYKSHLIRGELNKVFSGTGGGWPRVIEFKDYLYVAIARFSNDPDSGAQIWRTRDGQVWEPACAPAFGNVLEPAGMFHSMYFAKPFVFRGKLYVGLGWWYTDNETFWETKGGQLWRTENGTEWEKVMDLASDPHNEYVGDLVEFEGMLYASTQNWYEGFEIWRSQTGNPGDWTRVADDSLGTYLVPGGVTPIVNGNTLFLIPCYLYDQEYNQVPVHAWYTRDGLNWKTLTTDGFGDDRAWAAWTAVVFRGDIHVELGMYDPAQERAWTQITRIDKALDSEVYCGECAGVGYPIDGYFYRVWWDQGLVVRRSQDLMDWEQVLVPEVNDPGIISAYLLGKFKGEFYFMFEISGPAQEYQIWK
jgi:hypothetical protein